MSETFEWRVRDSEATGWLARARQTGCGELLLISTRVVAQKSFIDYTVFMENLFETKDLHLTYTSTKLDKVEKVHALNGVDLCVNRGEILAIAGESGCGKSTFAKALMGLEKITSGQILFEGKDFANFTPKELKEFRKKVQMIFQNPYASLNPKMKIFDILEESLIVNTDLSKKERHEIVLEKIKQVGLDEMCLEKYPHEFSGGQRQRIAIARALVLNPICIIADEPVSALDVSIQAQIINLLNDLKNIYKFTIIFISHDLRVIKYLADRVAVMYLGEVVELAETKELFNNPQHPYTKALLNAIPTFEEKKSGEISMLRGELPSVTNLPNGCKFHTRCPEVFSRCADEHPKLLGESHYVRCHKVNGV